MSIAEVEAKIRAAVAEAKAKGWRIIKDAYFAPGKRCCPLGACVLDEIDATAARAEVPERAGRVLGLSPRDAIYVATGLDGRVEILERDQYGKLGERLRDLVDP